MPSIPAACRVAVYPLLVGGGLAASVAALDRGLDPRLVAVSLTAVGVVFVAAFEQILPHRADWQRSRDDVLTDALHLVLSVSVAGEVGRRLALSTAGWLDLWPHRWPVLAQLILALLVAELGVYGIHRLQHTWAPAWRIHAIHHSAERIYFLNASRVHPLDSALTALLAVGPLAALGISPEMLAIFSVVAGIHSTLQHANIDLRLGPFNTLLSAAEVHRWHHSRDMSESNANYGQVLLVWDLLFGTYRPPAAGSPVVGLSEGDLPLPSDWLGQVTAPFRSRFWR